MSSYLSILLAAGLFFIIGKALVQGYRGTPQMICPACGTQGEPLSKVKGSIWIEVVLWLCFIVPGLIYSIWRLSSRYPACPACGQPGMIPVTSPNGQRLAEQFKKNGDEQ